MPNGFSGIAAQFGSDPLPNCAAIERLKKPAPGYQLGKTGAVWRDAVWQWLLYSNSRDFWAKMSIFYMFFKKLP